MKCVFEHTYFQMFGLNWSNFHPVEVVDRGSETQLQVGK